MTRKQAVLAAIEVLSKNKKNAMIVEVLEQIYDDLPLVHWTREMALDALQDFYLENNRLPVNSELGRKLPAKLTLKRLFGIGTLTDIERTFFPDQFIEHNNGERYWWYSEDDFQECFVRNYMKINGGKYVRYDDYDKYREAGTPSLANIIDKLKCDSYRELIERTEISMQKRAFEVSSNKRILLIPDTWDWKKELAEMRGEEV